MTTPHRITTRLSTLFALSVVAFVFGAGAGAAVGAFTDVSAADVHANDIEWLADEGLTKGCNPPANTAFCPDEPVSRAELASFVHRLVEKYDLDNEVSDGEDGVDGDAGVDGLDGADGEDGEDGASAYEIAVANGFVGSEPEWLESLQAPVDDLFSYEEGLPRFFTIFEFEDPVDVEPVYCPEGSVALVGGHHFLALTGEPQVDAGHAVIEDGARVGWTTTVSHGGPEPINDFEITMWVICVDAGSI